MAIALDNTSLGTWANNASSQTVAHTTAGTNRLLLVFVHFASSGSPSATVTYAGTSMTLAKGDVTYVTSSGGAQCYYLVNPAVGTNNIVATVSGTSTATNVKITGISFTGVVQTAPEASTLTKTLSTSAPANITTIASNAWVVTSDVVDANDTLTAPSGYTAVNNNGTATTTAATSGIAYKGPIAAAGAQTLAWADSTSDNNLAISISLAPVASTGVGDTMYRHFQVGDGMSRSEVAN